MATVILKPNGRYMAMWERLRTKPGGPRRWKYRMTQTRNRDAAQAAANRLEARDHFRDLHKAGYWQALETLGKDSTFMYHHFPKKHALKISEFRQMLRATGVKTR